MLPAVAMRVSTTCPALTAWGCHRWTLNRRLTSTILCPDGNATLARLLARKLIPAVDPAGHDMNDIVRAKFDDSQLDRADPAVKLRLNTTGIQVVNVDGGVEVSYITGEKLTKVRAGKAVMAGYNMMFSYLVPQMSQAQQEALRQNVKAPLVYSKVTIANWQAFIKLGAHQVDAPGASYSRIKPDYPVSLVPASSRVRGAL